MDATRLSFQALVDQPLVRSDLARAALLVGRVVHPELDVEEGLARLVELAGEAAGQLDRPDADSLARELFGSGRLRGNFGDYYEPENSVLSSVLTRGLGIPITLAVIFIDVGHRLGLAIDGVGLPGHFLTVHDGRLFDPFHAGAVLDMADCRRLYQRFAGPDAVLPDGALDPVAPQAIVTRMLWNLRSIAEGRGDRPMLHRSLALLSALPDAPLQVRLSWAQSLAQRGRFDEAARSIEAAIGLAPVDAQDRLRTMAQRFAARLN